MARSVFGHRAQGLRLERIQASPSYRAGAFRNNTSVHRGVRQSAWSALGDLAFGGQERKPLRPLPLFDPRPTWARPSETGLRATWLGHSTVLLEIDGVRILTDPVWGPRASPSALVGPKRFHPTPVNLAGLPPLDAVLVSHDHYDHLDYQTILSLAPTQVPFYTSLGVGAHLQAWGIPPERIVELDWWESATLPGHDLRITAAPAQHFSGRQLGDRNQTLWSSFALRGPHHNVFFSGDTGLHPELQVIAKRLGPFDLVMLEVGAWHPSWGDIHLGPENALIAHRMLGGRALLPVHWGTFNLSVHAWNEPAETLFTNGNDALILHPVLGTPVEPVRPELHLDPWWRGVGT